MHDFSYKGVSYQVDDQGCLLDPRVWNKDFAEGMARECGIPVLSKEHWGVIDFVRDNFIKTGICPTIYATCKATGLPPKEMQKLFPAGYHRGLCRVAGVHYRVSHMDYGTHIRQSVADLRALNNDKVYRTDVRGFLVTPEDWDEDFARHRAAEMRIAKGEMTVEHWQVINFLRDSWKKDHRIPTIYETCESCNVDLGKLEELFPDGYHRGAIKAAGLRFFS
ncbi:MAG: TusE/DsrC/DsvC family sulfur relay protein [Desulfobulbaceae bacterium]|jgi:tRNA 2-thiouridine synthesizing protein E|nr:TusE/DsrC/DsvC family sulfur relay protein [Desulfobulbaceae bacterium]